MIRSATQLDIPQLKKIWDRCFDDPLNYVDFLYDCVTTPQNTLVWDEEGKILSMAMSIDCMFSYKEEQLPCVYIYGCATLPEAEGKGIMTRLISYAEQLAAQRGVQMSVLVPGERFLYGFYRKRGYNSDFPLRTVTLRPGMMGDVPQAEEPLLYDRISPEELYAIRENALYEVPHIEWKADQITFIMRDALAYGEHVASYSGAAGKAYAIYGAENRSMFIKECLGTSELATKILLAALINEQDPRRVTLRGPVGAGVLPFEGVRQEYGMSKVFKTAKPLSDLAPFMNLMLD